MFSLRRQLLSPICRLLLDQYLDECQSWYDCHSVKTESAATTMENVHVHDHRAQQDPPSPPSAPSPSPSAARSPKRTKMKHVTTDAELEVAWCRDPSFRCQWPASAIPVEIFEIITSYLPRAEIKTLRQVCREFDHKASAQYFRNVVVPFRSELYGSLSRDENGDIQQHPVSLLSNAGNRIFESFGPHILRFALSLEIDEDNLAHPPLKPSQEAVPSFWGIYRWPHRTYNRYADLESIEQTADETQGMKDVLRCLTKVRNLGLCCDAGLGFLIRPDALARSAVVKAPVFATNDWRREHRAFTGSQGDETIVTVADFNGERRPRRKDSTDSLGYKQSVLEKMAVDAGYEGDEVQEAIGLLLETEGQVVDQISFDGRPVEPPAEAQRAESDRVAVVWPNLLEGRRRQQREQPLELTPHPPRHTPALIPNNLSKAQKELILELEWAHRAMIQSFVISIVDNASVGCFGNLTTLTIAKIPSSHIYMLSSDDFWDSLPQLNNVSLGVIADWRRITKSLPGYIEDHQVSPVQAVAKVYALLNDYIGKQSNIESLHFEWICGGEFAPSFAQRNKYVLPAPFLGAASTASPAESLTENLLKLPYVKHLSLKNCWTMPHVLWQMVRQMSLASLENLQLESVSLSARYTFDPQLPLPQQPANHATIHQQANNILGVFNAAQPAPNPGLDLWATQPPTGSQAIATAPLAPPPPQAAFPPPPGAQGPYPAQPDLFDPPPPPGPLDPPATDLYATPEWHSWSGFLEHFSPGRNVRRTILGGGYPWVDDNETRIPWELEVQKARGFIPDTEGLLVEEKRYKLKSIDLRSCGRVAIDDSHIATRTIARASFMNGPHSASDTQANLSKYMLHDWDPMLGRILPTGDPQDLYTLTEVFGLVHGWHTVYPAKIIADARDDGITMPGMGRFSGVLTRWGTRIDFEDEDAVPRPNPHINWVLAQGPSYWMSSSEDGLDDSE